MKKVFAKPLVLIDGSSYLHRAFHALPALANSKGQPTGAIYGVINMIKKTIADFYPEEIGIIFDSKAKTFRHEMYPEYKATRPKMPDELKSQIEPLFEIIKAMGLPLLVIPQVEADDVIATLAKNSAAKGREVLISSGDKDLAQLIDEKVHVVNTMSDLYLDEKGAKEKFGVLPKQMIDYLALVGDSIDNVPGVPKVGPKTAIKWLEQYGSLEKIISHAEEISGKIGENLRDSISHLPLAKKLVTLKDDLDLGVKPEDLARKSPNNEKLLELFQNLEFKSWLADISHKKESSHYQIVLLEKDFLAWLTKFKAAKELALDLETDSLDIINAKIVGISLALKNHPAIYIPVKHDYLGAPTQLDCDYVLKELKPILENKEIEKLGQNLKFDFSVLQNYGITLEGITFDTMLESYVLNSASNRHDKETLALQYLGEKIITFEDVAGKGAKQVSFNQVKLEKAGEYAASDADLVWRLHQKIWPELARHKKLVEVFEKIEMPMLTVLARMERVGVKIDPHLLKKQAELIAKKLVELEKEAFEISKEHFNLNSPLQLQEILFEKLKLPVLGKTPTGQPSTAESVLQELALDYPLPKIVLEYRSLSKLKSTYLEALPEQINAKTGRIHTSYNQAITSTGRLSSTNPNLQNIPARTEEGKKIRQAFIADRGSKIISADYSQIELRIMAHLSKDEGLLKAFSREDDIHKATAAEIFGVDLQDVNAEQRRKAKAINFGLIYGMSAFGLAKQLGIERKAAQEYVDIYFKRYPKVKDYMEEMRSFAYQNGFVETIFGRRLYIPDIKSKNFARRAAAERAAINAPMQGSAADIMKIAMINIDHWLAKEKIAAQMIMQVHDELVFEAKENICAKVKQYVVKAMEEAVKIGVPLRVSVGIGDNWDQAH
jgi:DNA polymerase I